MILQTNLQENYELIDAGNGEKLERYGSYTMVRPDPEALWEKSCPSHVWDAALLRFVRTGTKTKWIIADEVPKEWNIDYGGFCFRIAPSSFKHTGLFPEHLPSWEWLSSVILKHTNEHAITPKILNLFAYTGGATLACARAGAEVCHVDGSKTAVAWARTNAELSGLSEKPIRWIVEDVILFLQREIKRGNRYDGIIMDPPSFGHGPQDELWKIESHFLLLMKLCKGVLSDTPLLVLINGYTAGYSPLVYENNIKDMMKDCKGMYEVGELAIAQKSSDKLLPCGIFARWERI
jgi:23S rRNA (cytosine1962-C5)-methyltransferase